MYDPQTRFQELLVGITSDVVLMSFTHMVCGPNRRHGDPLAIDADLDSRSSISCPRHQHHRRPSTQAHHQLHELHALVSVGEVLHCVFVFCGIGNFQSQLYEFIFSFFTRPRLESQRPRSGSGSVSSSERATGGAVGVEGLDPDQERSRRTAARKGNTENRGKRLTENCGACASSSSG